MLDFWNRVNPHIILKSACGQSCCHCLTLNTYCSVLSFEEREIGVAFYWIWGRGRAMATAVLDFTAGTRRASHPAIQEW